MKEYKVISEDVLYPNSITDKINTHAESGYRVQWIVAETGRIVVLMERDTYFGPDKDMD